ncbi:hypothetical protein VC33_26770 [Pseudomonas fluorescens]|jgi:hypothetical protein|nr:hypothetical protein VC33_26770 [Pseudomonas fluorescens]OOG10428.1 hypothetical protein BMS17_28310 [Pseudomonas sp. C9]
MSGVLPGMSGDLSLFSGGVNTTAGNPDQVLRGGGWYLIIFQVLKLNAVCGFMAIFQQFY